MPLTFSMVVGVQTLVFSPGLLALLFAKALQQLPGTYPLAVSPDNLALIVLCSWLGILAFCYVAVSSSEKLVSKIGSGGRSSDELDEILSKALFPCLLTLAVTSIWFGATPIVVFTNALLSWFGWCIAILACSFERKYIYKYQKSLVFNKVNLIGFTLLFVIIHGPGFWQLVWCYYSGASCFGTFAHLFRQEIADSVFAHEL